MRRREFIALLGGAAAWPVAARAQQAAMPVIGFLGATSPDAANVDYRRVFRQALKESGYVEGENVAIEYRWAGNQLDRLPALAAELVSQRVAVVASVEGPPWCSRPRRQPRRSPSSSWLATTQSGLVLSRGLAQPGGNLTGINFLTAELVAKRLELLRALVPTASRVAMLVNPANTANTETTLRDAEPAARAVGLKLQVLNADTSHEIDVAFATIVRERPDALFSASSPYFTSRRIQLVQLAARHAIPAAYPGRQYVEVGGLMSYGANVASAWRQLGVYAGRILKGEKPADLPVVQSTKFELVINAQTARMLGPTVPSSLLAIADEVIE